MNNQDYTANLQEIAKIAKLKTEDKSSLKRLYRAILLAAQESFRANNKECFYLLGGAVRCVKGHYIFYPDKNLKKLLESTEDTGTSAMLQYEENRFMDLIKRALAEIDGEPDDPSKRRKPVETEEEKAAKKAAREAAKKEREAKEAEEKKDGDGQQ